MQSEVTRDREPMHARYKTKSLWAVSGCVLCFVTRVGCACNPKWVPCAQAGCSPAHRGLQTGFYLCSYWSRYDSHSKNWELLVPTENQELQLPIREIYQTMQQRIVKFVLVLQIESKLPNSAFSPILKPKNVETDQNNKENDRIANRV